VGYDAEAPSLTVRTPFGYYFLWRPEAPETPRIRAPRDFLVEEAALSNRSFLIGISLSVWFLACLALFGSENVAM